MHSARRPVLLAGASGFVGRHLQTHLLDLGYPVHALVRPASVRRAGIDARCRVIEGALDDIDLLRRALSEAGAVVYAAGTVRGRRADDFHAANVAGVASLIEALRASGTGLPLVLISSLAASRPELSDYAASKRAGEALLDDAADLAWTILRPPAVYGPGDVEMRPLLDLVRRGVALRPGPPQQRLALLHAHDLARAVAACLDAAPVCRQRLFAIDDGKPGGYGWAEIAAAVRARPVLQIGVPGALLRAVAGLNVLAAGALGYAPMLSPGKVRELQQPSWLCDNSPFTQATGWQPKIGLEQGAAALFR